MNTERRRSTEQALAKTLVMLDKFTGRKTFDKHQKAENDKRVAFYTKHAEKLQGMLRSA